MTSTLIKFWLRISEPDLNSRRLEEILNSHSILPPESADDQWSITLHALTNLTPGVQCQCHGGEHTAHSHHVWSLLELERPISWILGKYKRHQQPVIMPTVAYELAVQPSYCARPAAFGMPRIVRVIDLVNARHQIGFIRQFWLRQNSL